MPQLFRVKAKNIVNGGGEDFHTQGEIKPADAFRGADIGWLVQCGAIEPVGGTATALLVTSNPRKSELIAEVGRLQQIIEDLVAKADSQSAELADLRELRDRVPIPLRHADPVEEDDPSEVASLRAQVEELRKGFATLTAERDALRQRNDSYARQLSAAEHPSPQPADAAHVGTAPPAAPPANQSPVPNPPTAKPGRK